MNEYLEFKVIEEKPKTKVWGVYSKLHGDKLGEIRWFGRWRQYTFFPETGTIWNNDCLETISNFLGAEKAMRKAFLGDQT